eukprot:5195589-Karenia_brevis.AAC.1
MTFTPENFQALINSVHQLITTRNNIMPMHHQHLALTLQTQQNMTTLQQQYDNLHLIANLQHQLTTLHRQIHLKDEQQLPNSLSITSYKYRQPRIFHDKIKNHLEDILDIDHRDRTHTDTTGKSFNLYYN